MNPVERSIRFEEIMGMERFYRQALINTISGFRGAHLIGTINPAGQTNLAIFNSVTHIGANPPYLGFILRPTSVERHTYDNIISTGAYTINHVHLDMIPSAHQTSAKYPADVSEFDACRFTPQFSDALSAPYVAESRIKIGMQFVEVLPISLNDTSLIIGRIVEILLPPPALLPTGHINLDEWGSAAVSGLDTYYRTERIARFAYARPNEPVRVL